MLGLRVPVSDGRIASIIDELLELNGHVEATIRLVLTGGVSPDGMHFDPDTPTFFILTHDLFDVPEQYYRSGAGLITFEHRRELPEAKSTAYITWLRLHEAIEKAEAIDVLYHDGGVVADRRRRRRTGGDEAHGAVSCGDARCEQPMTAA